MEITKEIIDNLFSENSVNELTFETFGYTLSVDNHYYKDYCDEILKVRLYFKKGMCVQNIKIWDIELMCGNRKQKLSKAKKSLEELLSNEEKLDKLINKVVKTMSDDSKDFYGDVIKKKQGLR